jgi:hypothetical protein
MKIHFPDRAFIAAARFVFSAFRNSPVRIRRIILRRRSRPNLDLSPFLSDTVSSLAGLRVQVETTAHPAWSYSGIQLTSDGIASALSSDTAAESMAAPGTPITQEAASASSSPVGSEMITKPSRQASARCLN